jgi:HD superfamily phosphodiesterase
MDCDPNTESMLEGIVQGLRTTINGVKVAFMYGEGSNLDLIDKLQNGPDFISFHLPLEGDLLLDWLFIVAPVDIPANKIKWDYLTSVRIPDLAPNEKIDFDLYHYMRANKKFILYTRKDGQLTPEQIERFRKNEVRDFYVRKNQLGALQAFLARRLSEVRKNSSLTETEKRERLRKEAKEVFRSLLGAKSGSPKESRMVLESCKSVAMTFIQDTSDHPEFYQKLMQITAQGSNNYSHSVNVSIYSTLFAMVLGEKNFEAASVAGLLHDVGLSTLRRKVDEIDESALSEADLVQLRAHPDSSVRLLREKSTLDDETIFSAIAQHRGAPAAERDPLRSRRSRQSHQLCVEESRVRHRVEVLRRRRLRDFFPKAPWQKALSK